MFTKIKSRFLQFFNKDTYKAVQVFLGQHQNTVFIILNVTLFFLSVIIFSSNPLVVLIGSILWWDFYALMYVLFLLEVPVFPIVVAPFLAYKVTILVLLYGSVVNFVFLYILLLIFLTIYENIISKKIKTEVQIFQVDQATIQKHFVTEFLYFSVLFTQCQIFLFFFGFFAWQAEGNLFEYINSFRQEEVILLYFFLFITLGSLLLIFFIEIVIVNFFNTEVIGFGSKLWTYAKYAGTLFLGAQATDQFMMHVAHKVPFIKPIVDHYRVKRTGLYTYNFSVEYTRAQKYEAITGRLPPLISGTNQVDYRVVDHRLALFEGLRVRQVSDMNNLVSGPHTKSDILHLADKQIKESNELIYSLSCSEEISKKASEKLEANKKTWPAEAFYESYVDQEGRWMYGHENPDGTRFWTEEKPKAKSGKPTVKSEKGN